MSHITPERIQEIKEILIKGRPYFRKDNNSPCLVITFDSPEEDLKKAIRYMGKYLHQDLVALQNNLSDAERKQRVELFKEIHSAIEDIRIYRGKKRPDFETPSKEEYRATITLLLSRLNILPNNKMINYFELFGFNRNQTSEQILSSLQYRMYNDALKLENIDLVQEGQTEQYRKLLSIFKEFDNNILRNKEGRYFYERLLDQQTTNNAPHQEKPKKNLFAEELNKMLQEYNMMLQENFVNYYSLFNLDSDMTRIEILNAPSVRRLNILLKPERFSEYGLDQSQQKLFNSLCKTFDMYIKWTLSTDERKAAYDKSLKEYLSQKIGTKGTTHNPQPKKTKVEADYRYIFGKEQTNPSEILSLKVKKLYKAIEQGIKTYGVSATVLMLKKLFQTKNIKSFDTKMITLMKPYDNSKDIQEIFDELLEKYQSSNTLALAEKVVSGMLSRKIDALSAALTHTAKKHGIPHTVTALHKYVTEDTLEYISHGDEKNFGREKIMMEISSEFIKYVLAATDSSKFLLLDFPEHLEDQFEDLETINKLVRELVQTKRKGFTQ